MNELKLYVPCFILLLCGTSFAANEQDVIASVEYFYAQDGALIGRAVNGVRQDFEYDKRGQLLAVKDAAGRDLERYTYDPAGNRLSKTVNGVTTTYTYDEANQLKTSTVNGKTTNYRYDAAGRLVQAGDKIYYYFGANDKVTEVRQGDKVIAEFDYFMDGQIASAKYPDREESFTWDGLALVQRNEVSYLNEPYVTGGNPILSSRDGVMFNDMLGSTLNIGGQSVGMTSFGESADDSAFFTGKPMIPELGYLFLFRDYNPSQGKWTSSDPLGYPDGWNNLVYCNNVVTDAVDKEGLSKMRFTLNDGNEYILYDPTVSQIKETIDIIKRSNQKLSSWHIIGHADNSLLVTNAASTPKETINVFNNKIVIVITSEIQFDITSDIQGIIDYNSEIYLDGCRTAQSEKWICSATTDIAREMSKIVDCIVSGNTGFVLYPGKLFEVGWSTLGDKQSYRRGVAE